jgi:hypothetical protein
LQNCSKRSAPETAAAFRFLYGIPRFFRIGFTFFEFSISLSKFARDHAALGAARFFIDLCRYSVIMEDDGCDTKYSHHTILEESKKEDLSYAETQKARA